MTRLRIFAVLAAALLLVACSSNPKEQEDAGQENKDSRGRDSLFSLNKKGASRGALEVPPDLLGSSSDKVRENQRNNGVAGSGSEVLPEVIGATIQSDQGKSWLEIDADAEVVWRKLTEFWAIEEIELVAFQPESGLMETDWFAKTKRASANAGFGSIAVELLEAFTARRTALDKFTIRLERDGAGGTNLYVTHRGREKIARVAKSRNQDSEFEWVERQQDPEKIAQLLQTIVLLFDSEAEAGDEAEEPA